MPRLALLLLLYTCMTAQLVLAQIPTNPQDLIKNSATALAEALHPADALYLHTLAEALRDQGYYKEAEPLYQRAVVIWEAALGKDHPAVASALHSLARLYHVQGRANEAEGHYLRAIAIWEAAFGPAHPSVGFSLPSLAQFYAQQGRYDDAERLYLRAISIIQGAFPPGLPFADGIRAEYEDFRQQRK